MDNNTAERRERGPVVARKNSMVSGAIWSGRLGRLAVLAVPDHAGFGVVGKWLSAYLIARQRLLLACDSARSLRERPDFSNNSGGNFEKSGKVCLRG